VNKKIIGFLISKDDVEPYVDFFDVDIKIITLKHAGYNIYLWGIEDLNGYKINNKYSLSFPLSDSLLDRNVLISFEGDTIVVENDWLGSIPVFYNSNEKIVSTLSNLCLKDKTIHHEGLANFSEFGYSVFEQTIFRDVKFMRYFSKLVISDEVEVNYKNDPVLEASFLDGESTEESVIDLMQEYVLNVESKINGDIVLPTSGGYDSRILNYFVKDKSRIRSFTYGVSQDQAISTEVAHAKKISEIYNTSWEQIKLDEFHKYTEEWSAIYGFSTHLHGMYHIEFYKKILKTNKFTYGTFLSGIVGDAWAGSITYRPITNVNDVSNLGYSHGMNLDVKYLTHTNDNLLKKKYFTDNKEYFKNNKLNTVFTIRLKMILISYLSQIPEYFGIPVWTPFLNFDVVKATLNIPENRREKRSWQKDFFESVSLDLENMSIVSNKSNNLDFNIAKNSNFEPINIDLIGKYIDKKKLFEINSRLNRQTELDKIKNILLNIPKIGGALRRIGVKNDYLNSVHEYYVIKSIEKAFR
jgi:hypothetical protein